MNYELLNHNYIRSSPTQYMWLKMLIVKLHIIVKVTSVINKLSFKHQNFRAISCPVLGFICVGCPG